MDDLTITTNTHVQARWIMQALEETVEWARMTLKPRKSRSLIIKIWKISQQFKLTVSTTGNRIKCLGKWFDDTLCDKTNVNRISKYMRV